MDKPYHRLVIPPRIVDALLAHALAEAPRECCGVLAGPIVDGAGHVRESYPVRNDLASKTRYFTNPRDLLAVTRATALASQEWLAIYHSHPASPAIPSRIDLAENTYGISLAHVILGLESLVPEIRAWWLHEHEFAGIELSLE